MVAMAEPEPLAAENQERLVHLDLYNRRDMAMGRLNDPERYQREVERIVGGVQASWLDWFRKPVLGIAAALLIEAGLGGHAWARPIAAVLMLQWPIVVLLVIVSAFPRPHRR